MASAAAEAGEGGASRSVVILPGLGNNAKDYEGLAGLLTERGLHVEVRHCAAAYALGAGSEGCVHAAHPHLAAIRLLRGRDAQPSCRWRR